MCASYARAMPGRRPEDSLQRFQPKPLGVLNVSDKPVRLSVKGSEPLVVPPGVTATIYPDRG
jgi:hypothetical protein